MGYSMYTTSVKNKKETYTASLSEIVLPDSEERAKESSKPTTPRVMEDDVTENPKILTESEMEKCEKDFAASLKTNKTEYEKGRVLVGFNKDISFSQAKSIIARYDLEPVLAGVDESSYLLTRLLTVNVPTSKESHFVCVFKQDSSVRYSNISSYLFLHN